MLHQDCRLAIAKSCGTDKPQPYVVGYGTNSSFVRHPVIASVTKAPADLSARETALLAAVLPNPLGRDAGSPGRGTRRIARVIERRIPAQRGHAGCLGPG